MVGTLIFAVLVIAGFAFLFGLREWALRVFSVVLVLALLTGVLPCVVRACGDIGRDAAGALVAGVIVGLLVLGFLGYVQFRAHRRKLEALHGPRRESLKRRIGKDG